jgi:uncharacterized protein
MIKEIPVIFHNGGTQLAGVIFRNTADINEAQPGVILSGAWLTVKEQMATHYARRLADRGYTTLVFDFSGFGRSEGEPRQTEISTRKINDIYSAACFFRTLSLVKPDGIGYLGICASAQYTMAAISLGAPIESFVSVAGWFHDPQSIAGFYGGKEGVERRLALASKAMQSYLSDRHLEIAPAYRPGDENAGIFFELDYYSNQKRGAVPQWKNEMAVMSWFYWFAFDGLRSANNFSVPSLFVHSEGSVFPDNVKTVVERIKGEKKILWYTGSQIDFYDQESQVNYAIDAADQHFQRTLNKS